MRRKFLPLCFLSSSLGCVVHADAEGDCGYDESYECYLEHTPGYGYSRVCELTLAPLVCIELDDDDGRTRYQRSSAGSASASSGARAESPPAGDTGESDGGVSLADDGSGFEAPCERDSQCGDGLCMDGLCHYACEVATDCGTADACLAVDGVSICSPPDAPTVQCNRSADCGYGEVCLNAACHQSCASTSDCGNVLDRCVAGVCVPDRRVVSECLLDRECPADEVCIDGGCEALYSL